MSFQSPFHQGLRQFPMTLLLLAVCVGVWLLQLIVGVDVTHPSNQALLTWGANFLPYSIGDAPWRMVSSLFLHIGLLHLMFNMFALYYFGQVAERMFGSVHLLLLFLWSGIGGNVLNNYLGWQDWLDGHPPILSAGASGGIMGIGMALLVTAIFKTPINQIMLNSRSLFMIMGINLLYGFFVGNIDNAGHVGGAVTGAILATIYIIQYRHNCQNASRVFPKYSSTLNTNTVLPLQRGYFKPSAVNGKIALLGYIATMLVMGWVYSELHAAYIAMFANTPRLLF